MTQNLVVVGPGTVWIAEDHLLALVAFLDGLHCELEQIVSGLLHCERLWAERLEDSLFSADSSRLRALRLSLESLIQDATWLRHALVSYARETADQERARVHTFDVPRDRAFAFLMVSLSGEFPETDFSSWGIPQAAQSLLGPGLAEPEVRVVERHDPVVVQQASSIAERVGRIPPGETPIRIERFVSADGSFDTDVYIAGTEDWGVGISGGAFNMRSNLALVGGMSAASMVAVGAAMKQVGVRPGDRVTFVGHSQGGLIATRLAESGQYETTGLVTVGAPLGAFPVTGDYPAVTVSHTDDVVPGLAGHQRPTKAVGIEAASGAQLGDVLGAHSRERYLHTAEAADRSPAAAQFGDWSGSARQAQASLFTATRLPPG